MYLKSTFSDSLGSFKLIATGRQNTNMVGWIFEANRNILLFKSKENMMIILESLNLLIGLQKFYLESPFPIHLGPSS